MKRKVLHVQGGMKKGGTESVIMGWYRNLYNDNIQFDFTTMTKEECSYDKEIIKNGDKLLYVPSRSDAGSIKHCYHLYKCIKYNGPYDIVHSHMNFHGGIVAIIAKLAGVKKVVCHAHNTNEERTGLKRKVEINILQKALLKFSDELVACGKRAGEFVFGNDSKFNVINNAIDINEFSPEKIDEIKKLKAMQNLDDTLVLGHIGRFSLQKNHKFIISIIEKLKTKNIKFKFILIGDGELKDEFFDEVASKGVEEYIMYLGTRDDISLWMNIIDILIFPSLFEGLPVTLIEAQASGLPCIISDRISDEVDLGLDLITKCSIENEKIWVNEILKGKNRIYDKSLIEERLREEGYLIEDSIKRLLDIYNV